MARDRASRPPCRRAPSPRQLGRVAVAPQRADALHSGLPGAVDVVAAVADVHHSARVRSGRGQQHQSTGDDNGLRPAPVIVGGPRHGVEARAEAGVLDDLPGQGLPLGGRQGQGHPGVVQGAHESGHARVDRGLVHELAVVRPVGRHGVGARPAGEPGVAREGLRQRRPDEAHEGRLVGHGDAQVVEGRREGRQDDGSRVRDGAVQVQQDGRELARRASCGTEGWSRAHGCSLSAGKLGQDSASLLA